MDYFIRYIRLSSRDSKIAYMQGFFENVGEIDPLSGFIRAPVVIEIAADFIELLEELHVPFGVIDVDPRTIAIEIPIEEAFRVPLLNPTIKDGKYYLMRSVLQPPNQ